MLPVEEINENFELATVACDQIIKSLKQSKNFADDDARLSYFYKIRTLNNMFKLSHDFYKRYLITDKWWVDNYQDFIISNKNKRKLCNEYDMFLRSSFITEIFSAFESSMRVLINAEDQENYNKNKHSFFILSRDFLNKLDLQDENKLIRIFSIIRNSIHNNGMFFPLDGKNEEIVYKNKVFSFKVGDPIIYAGWVDLFSITKLVLFLFVAIIDNPKITSKHIKEPASVIWDKL